MIYGINAMSLIDYPSKISFVIFTGGCNFSCPYCHNKDIVRKKTKIYSHDEVINNLKVRKKLIDAVVITGGEPTIYGNQLRELIIKIKELGYLIKLDTNGSNPGVLKQLIEDNLLDYIAMDIKNTFSKYELTTGVNIKPLILNKSIKLIENSGINYEFRLTINQDMHTEEDIKEVASYFANTKKLFLQSYRYSTEQLKDINYKTYSVKELEQFQTKYQISLR